MSRSTAATQHNIAQWTSDDSGGPYFPHHVPELVSADIREFFDGLR